MSEPGNVNLDFSPTTAEAIAVVPVSGLSKWVDAIAPPGLTTSDLLTDQIAILDPMYQITESSRNFLHRQNFDGTTLRVMMQYDIGDKPDPAVSPLTIRVFGRADSSDIWLALRNLNGDASVPVVIDPNTDTQDMNAGHAFTVPDNNAHCWDCAGCNEFIIGVEQVYAPDTGGEPTHAVLWAKIV